jgi:hypothetical protein
MTPEEIARQRAVIAAATEGPWEVCPWDMYIFGPKGQMVADSADVYEETIRLRGYGARLPMEANGAFIAEARTAWPAALDEVERLKAEVADIKGEVEDALGIARVWGCVDCEARTYTEAIEVLAQDADDTKAENARLRQALSTLLSHAQSDPTMESAHWHWRSARGAEVHKAITAAKAALEFEPHA